MNVGPSQLIPELWNIAAHYFYDLQSNLSPIAKIAAGCGLIGIGLTLGHAVPKRWEQKRVVKILVPTVQLLSLFLGLAQLVFSANDLFSSPSLKSAIEMRAKQLYGEQILTWENDERPKVLFLLAENLRESDLCHLQSISFKLLTEKYDVKLAVISSLDELCQQLQSPPPEMLLKTVNIQAHGSSYAFFLSSENKGVFFPWTALPRDCFERLSEDASINLSTCSGGAQLNLVHNLAQHLANLSQRVVNAATANFKFWITEKLTGNNEPLHMRYYNGDGGSIYTVFDGVETRVLGIFEKPIQSSDGYIEFGEAEVNSVVQNLILSKSLPIDLTARFYPEMPSIEK